MDEKKQSFFRPNQDFPVVGGDSGKVSKNMSEIWNRTPGSEKFKKEQRQNLMILNELQELEKAQSDYYYRHYREHKNALSSNSEKIYFLKLRTLKERDEYLFARGLNKSRVSPEESEAVRQREIIVGMSKQSVLKSWGRPSRVDIAGEPRYENERWAYLKMGRVNYVYFESGFVQGWRVD